VAVAATSPADVRQPEDRDEEPQAGYLRKNGVPYSDKATLTEYWDLMRQPDGDQWLVITTVVEDSTYLALQPGSPALNFKEGSRSGPSGTRRRARAR
jgi:hypothetical protein